MNAAVSLAILFLVRPGRLKTGHSAEAFGVERGAGGLGHHTFGVQWCGVGHCAVRIPWRPY